MGLTATYTCAPSVTSGFRTGLFKKGGSGIDVPYSPKDFSKLVITVWWRGRAHFWVIPVGVLKRHGYVKTDTQKGKMGITVHSSEIGQQAVARSTYTFSKKYYKKKGSSL